MSVNRGGYVLTGDWGRLRSFLSSGQEFVDGVNEVIKEEAEHIREEVSSEIPFSQNPNAESTIKRKGFNAPLLESGVYKSQGIVVNEYGSRDKGFKMYYVIQGNDQLAVESGERDHDGLTYAGLLEIMENGSSAGRGGAVNIPKRPVLTITFDREKSKLEREIIGKAFKLVHEALR